LYFWLNLWLGLLLFSLFFSLFLTVDDSLLLLNDLHLLSLGLSSHHLVSEIFVVIVVRDVVEGVSPLFQLLLPFLSCNFFKIEHAVDACQRLLNFWFLRFNNLLWLLSGLLLLLLILMLGFLFFHLFNFLFLY